MGMPARFNEDLQYKEIKMPKLKKQEQRKEAF